MNTNAAKNRLTKARDASIAKFGEQSAALGDQRVRLNVVPSPSMMLDFKLGIGGFPYRHMVEIYGANGLGKTSALGYGTLANVQRQGRLPALIAMEPTFDAEWAQRLHGLDPELLLINRPDNAEEAFEMLHDLVYGGLVDYILVDSIGAMAAKSETQDEGKKKAFGVSGIVTSGLNAVMPRLYKNNQGLMIINQQRQDTKTRTQPGMATLYESPGGEALRHHAMIRIHLKPGKNRYVVKIQGDDVLVGRELVCAFKKNKLAQAANKSARFDFFHIETEDYGLGVDVPADVINTGKVAGVLEGTTWLKHASFPNGKLNGKRAVGKYLAEHPETYEAIRQEVLSKMLTNEIQATAEPPAEEPEETEAQDE